MPRPTTAAYEAYAAIMGTFVGGLAAAGVARARPRPRPACQTALDFAVLSAASFKAARTLPGDEVTSFIREPFVEGDAHDGERSPCRPATSRQAIGELVTCTRCVRHVGRCRRSRRRRSSRPRFGRLLTWSLAAAGANDFLQAGFAALTAKANPRDG